MLSIELPLYGVFCAADYWGVNVHEHDRNEVGMPPIPDFQ